MILVGCGLLDAHSMTPQEGEDKGGYFDHTIWCRKWCRDVTTPHQMNYTLWVDDGHNGIDFTCGMDARNGVVESFADDGRRNDCMDKK